MERVEFSICKQKIMEQKQHARTISLILQEYINIRVIFFLRKRSVLIREHFTCYFGVVYKQNEQ